MGSSIYAGFFLMFISQILEKFMMKWTSRTIIISNMLGWAMAALLTGFAYRIPNITTVIIVSFVTRIIQGLFAYVSVLAPIDFIHANFPNKFDMLNGLVQVGYFSGNGLGDLFGCIIYERFGYEIAYAISSLIALIAAASAFYFLPNTKTYLSIQEDESRDDQETKEIGSKKMKLSMFLIAPLAATMLINSNYGVLQVS
jgi:MFS family permease